jgi:hypothetical protein
MTTPSFLSHFKSISQTKIILPRYRFGEEKQQHKQIHKSQLFVPLKNQCSLVFL